MNAPMEKLAQWIKELETFHFPEWKALPDLDLYMDQVLTYLEREMSTLTVEDQEKMITSSMINNYVKGNLLPNPVQKKYSKNHLAYMIGICSIKQILSISDIARLFEIQREFAQDPKPLYDFFRETHANMLHNLAHTTQEKMDQFFTKHPEANHQEMNNFLYKFTFELAVEAEIKKIIANKILFFLSKSDDVSKTIDEKKTKQEIEKIEREIQHEKKNRSK